MEHGTVATLVAGAAFVGLLLLGASTPAVLGSTVAVWILTMYISLNWGSTPSAPQQPAAPVRARRSTPQRPAPAPLHSRIIPQWVKIAVAHRDGGTCRQCGSDYELQYDHIIPFSRGGSSTDVNNIQLLCGRCNRRKSNRYVG